MGNRPLTPALPGFDLMRAQPRDPRRSALSPEFDRPSRGPFVTKEQAMSRFERECGSDPAHRFSDVRASKGYRDALGPNSNTGPKGALVDYLTFVVDQSTLAARGGLDVRLMLGQVFGFQGEVVFTGFRARGWQFYRESGSLIDREGQVVGKVGRGGNNDSYCISLSGAGCRWVKNWWTVYAFLYQNAARITRLDLAYDDYDGERFSLAELRQLALNKEFMQGGTPPSVQYIENDPGKGDTLYVGKRGYKQLCIYQKGQQLGLKESPWVRCEVRLWGGKQHIPPEAILEPLSYLRGAYDVIGALLADVCDEACSRIKTVKKHVEATGEAMVRYLRRQVGPSLNLLMQALGGDWDDFMRTRIARSGTPGRFRGTASGDALTQLLRENICHALQ